MSPAATCCSKHHPPEHQHGVKLAQRDESSHTTLEGGGEVRSFFLFFFWMRLGVLLGSGHPQSSGMYNRKHANHNRHQGGPACHLKMLYPSGGLWDLCMCELQAMVRQVLAAYIKINMWGGSDTRERVCGELK